MANPSPLGWNQPVCLYQDGSRSPGQSKVHGHMGPRSRRNGCLEPRSFGDAAGGAAWDVRADGAAAVAAWDVRAGVAVAVAAWCFRDSAVVAAWSLGVEGAAVWSLGAEGAAAWEPKATGLERTGQEQH